jgi:hypothetical protein
MLQACESPFKQQRKKNDNPVFIEKSFNVMRWPWELWGTLR